MLFTNKLPFNLIASPFPKQNQPDLSLFPSPVPCSKIDITNTGFISAVFPNTPEKAFPATCTKTGDPGQGGWTPIRMDKTISPLFDQANNYINCSSFKNNSDGFFHARKDNFAACHFLLLDDLGSKGYLSRLGNFKVSWLIETSLGNYQAGIIFADPLTDFDQAEQLLSAIIAKGLCDSETRGAATRWARLPVGVNGKPKHKTDSGEPFHCRLVDWAPQNRYTTQEIVDGLGLSLASPSTNNRQIKCPPLSLNTGGTMHDGVCAKNTLSTNRKITLKQLSALLDSIDSDCGYNEWLHVLMAVFHETDGSNGGFELCDRWSSRGSKYIGSKEIRVKWRSFHNEPSQAVTVGTLIHRAQEAGADVEAILQNSDDVFEFCETKIINPADRDSDIASRKNHPLGKFSVSHDVRALEKQMVDQKPLLGKIILFGQASVIYAKPNTGKTLIVLFLIFEGIKNGKIEPSKLHYINMDDNSSGLVDKARFAQEYGFHMLADGYQNFEANEFHKAMQEMIENNTARGVVVVLDTLKKFVNTMDKTKCSKFSQLVRQFCLKGGTVIALSHANKNPGADGKSKYSGTSDIVDDFDCAYTLETVSDKSELNHKLVVFENIKRRGDVVMNAAYGYSLENAASYNELLLSVQEVDDIQLLNLKHSAEIQSDSIIITAIKNCILTGLNTKMKLADAAATQTSSSKRNSLKIIEKYTGSDPAFHHWTYVVGNRGAKIFVLLDNLDVKPIKPSI